jgi:hypothetical protein
MTDTRRKNVDWTVCKDGGGMSFDAAQLAVLMDIRDELKGIRSLMNCYRIPRALDALHEVGQDIRRKKRAAATKRRNVKGVI